MLFKNNSFRFKFCLMGLNAADEEEITNLITDNGGEICTTRIPPVITFSSSNDLCRIGEPVFDINYVRECVRQQKLLHLIHFIFGPPGFFGCLHCIFTSGKNACQLHSFDSTEFHPNFTSTQIERTSDTNTTNHCSRTQIEHNYANGDGLDAQTANVFVEKRPCNTEHVTKAPPRESNQSPIESDFSLLESPQDADFLPDESPQIADLPTAESLQDEDFLPDVSSEEGDRLLPESPQDEDFLPDATPREEDFLPDESPQTTNRLPPESLENTYVLAGMPRDEDSLPDESPQVADLLANNSAASMFSYPSNENERVERSDDFVPIRLPVVARPGTSSVGVVPMEVEVPDAVWFEELDGDQESEKDTTEREDNEDGIVAASSKIRVNPAAVNVGKTIGDGKTKDVFGTLDGFCLISSDSDETDYEPSISLREREQRKFRHKRSSPSSKKDLHKNNVSNNDTPQPGPSELVDLTTDDDVIEGSSEEEKAGRIRCCDIRKFQYLEQASTSKMKNSRSVKEERNTTVSSTIVNDDSDSSIEDRTPGAVASNRFPTKGWTDRMEMRQNVEKSKRTPVPIRNILPWEQRQMVKYLIDNSLISEAKGLRVWKQMIEDGFLVHRTPQSLNNHFRRVILPTIHRFQMDKKCLKKFQKLQT